MSLLVTVFEDELLDKGSAGEVVVRLRVIEERVNKEYNLVALLDSGKRVFLDVGAEGLRKSVVYQSPPNMGRHFSEQSPGSHTVGGEGSVVGETYCALLMRGGGSVSCGLLREEIYSAFEVVYRLDVEVHGAGEGGEYYLFGRELEVLGPLKEALLCGGRGVGPREMNAEVQQVFFRAQEVVHASDRMAQRVVLLRPVDVFFTIVNHFENLPLIARALQVAFPSVKGE